MAPGWRLWVNFSGLTEGGRGIDRTLRKTLLREYNFVVNVEVALFEAITTRSVSEGRSYVACDVFPRAVLAHASGCEKPHETPCLASQKAKSTTYERVRGGQFVTPTITVEMRYLPKPCFGFPFVDAFLRWCSC
jgi:hypothetical protein